MTDTASLEQVLDRLHAALLAADFNELPKIVAETDRLLAGLQGLPNTSTAARLRHKADRNGKCLAAAARGLRAAQRRLIDTAGTGAALSTYTNTGKRSEVGTGPASLTQRL